MSEAKFKAGDRVVFGAVLGEVLAGPFPSNRCRWYVVRCDGSPEAFQIFEDYLEPAPPEPERFERWLRVWDSGSCEPESGELLPFRSAWVSERDPLALLKLTFERQPDGSARFIGVEVE